MKGRFEKSKLLRKSHIDEPFYSEAETFSSVRDECVDRWPDKCASAADYGFCSDEGLKAACPVSCDVC